jgi:hypothetical protein
MGSIADTRSTTLKLNDRYQVLQADGAFNFGDDFFMGPYEVIIESEPSAKTCSTSSESDSLVGSVASSDIEIVIRCSDPL